MGEVYRARDTKLGRDVAIKVLPEDFASDRERIDRFEREARLLAQLNHPNVATLHGLEEHEGRQFLVMELVEGETLAERIARGPVSLQEATPLFIQIAEGLGAAHDKGVIHRDLKPANIKITPAGNIKILDFGLAKAVLPSPAAHSVSESPTKTKDTAFGVILGTALYMSPEQARGMAVDKRTDIWAFGCCLYEAITGKSAFLGKTVSDILAKVLERDPDWDALSTESPRVVRLIRRCLHKDPSRRQHDIADARLDIEEWLEDESSSNEGNPSRASIGLGWAVATFLLGVSLSALLFLRVSSHPESGEVRRLEISLPPTAPLAITEQPPFAISPDGQVVVYVGADGDTNRMFQRRLDEGAVTAIPDTQGAYGPFFSPDGESVAFFSGMELRRVTLTGGASQLISTASPVTRGANWMSPEEILITATNAHGLARGFAVDGTYTMVGPPDPSVNERNHSWPQGLPDGSVLVTVHKLGRESYEAADVAILDLETGARTVLLEGAYHARYVPTGHLIYVSRGILHGVAFSLAKREVRGSPVQLVDGVMTDLRTGAGYYSISDTGTLVYAAGGSVNSSQKQLVWVDRNARSEQFSSDTRVFRSPRISPEGTRVAVGVEGASDDLWIYDLTNGTFERFTFEVRNLGALWPPDGHRLTFSSTFDNRVPQIVDRAADGSGDIERLVTAPCASFAGSWTPNGETLAFTCQGRNMDIFLKSFEGDSAPVALLDTRFDETSPAFSPDGKWLAYVSDESGRKEVYVRSFRGPSSRIQLSTDGGEEPVWAKSGRELYYRGENSMMSVSVTTDTDDRLQIEQSTLLFEDRFDRSPVAGLTNYDVASDGRFLMVEPVEIEGPARLYVVLNFLSELERLVPTDE